MTTASPAESNMARAIRDSLRDELSGIAGRAVEKFSREVSTDLRREAAEDYGRLSTDVREDVSEEFTKFREELRDEFADFKQSIRKEMVTEFGDLLDRVLDLVVETVKAIKLPAPQVTIDNHVPQQPPASVTVSPPSGQKKRKGRLVKEAGEVIGIDWE